MIDLEAIAVRRADEQLAAGRWRRAERGEASVQADPVCEECGQEFKRKRRGPKPRMDLCARCRAAGYRPHPCPICERPMKTWDFGRPSCHRCRREVSER